MPSTGRSIVISPATGGTPIASPGAGGVVEAVVGGERGFQRERCDVGRSVLAQVQFLLQRRGVERGLVHVDHRFRDVQVPHVHFGQQVARHPAVLDRREGIFRLQRLAQQLRKKALEESQDLTSLHRSIDDDRHIACH